MYAQIVHSHENASGY